METALASLASGVNAVAGVDVGTVAVGVLGPSILGLQVEIDRLRVVQAHWLQAADVHRIWETSGHRDIASWLAAKGKTSKRTARAAAALGDGLARHAELDAKVAAGKISSDAAQALLPVLDGPHSGDPNELLDACDGATPFDAKAAAIKFKATNPPLGGNRSRPRSRTVRRPVPGVPRQLRRHQHRRWSTHHRKCTHGRDRSRVS